MEVVITPDAEAAAEVVAGVLAGVLAARPAPVLGLATGSSPLAAYRRLIDAFARQAGGTVSQGPLPGCIYHIDLPD